MVQGTIEIIPPAVPLTILELDIDVIVKVSMPTFTFCAGHRNFYLTLVPISTSVYKWDDVCCIHAQL